MRVQCLTRYDDLGASSRVRFSQYMPAFAALQPQWQWQRQALLDDDYLRRKYAGQAIARATLRGYGRRMAALLHGPAPDLRWIEKELWPWVPAAMERALLGRTPYALDFDDAIFHNYDLHRLAPVRRLWGRKIDRLMAGAALVTAGNAYLAQRAQEAGARRVEIVPTVIDLSRYPVPQPRPREAGEPLDIAWIGSPATVHYLQMLAQPLRQLAAQRPIRLVVIGGGPVELPGVPLRVRPWAADTEAAELAACHLGVMPLPDTPWERGKCGYKLIQYMACGLPVVGSAVGANREIVQAGITGFLAQDDTGWLQALQSLAAEPAQALKMGAAGRQRAAAHYAVQAVAPRLLQQLQQAVTKPPA